MNGLAALLVFGLAAVAALPAPADDPVLQKLDGGGPRYQYMRGGDQANHLVDLWLKASDVREAARYNPDQQNVYHLFTRQNPTVSQPMLIGSEGLLGLTNYDPARRTVVLLHGWLDSAVATLNTVLVQAFLSAEDLNLVVVDWSAGAGTINYIAAVANTVSSGESVARFVNWLNAVTGASAAHYHVVGHSLGGHQAGVVGRNVEGDVAYIHALDPANPGWNFNSNRLRASDSGYTEVVHTNAGLLGYLGTLGHTDFYPNGGINMPGCASQECDHDRGIFYLAESLYSSGFTGQRCATYVGAMAGSCFLWGTLQMGGLVPKTGSSGIYYLQTNAAPPFSLD